MKRLVGFLLLIAAAAAQGIDPLPFRDAAEEDRFRQLTAELRCVMCQNQSLADSNAGIAGDLRREVLDLMHTGKSDDEIKAFLVERYTEFVLYDPPLRLDTLLLWLGPAVVLFGGMLAVAVIIRRRSAALDDKRPPDDDTGEW
jgi:cytochrome c-type biogenesis protein CcmH